MAESRSLFHYTTAEGLIGIVRDRCLFATHANFLNDTSECKLITPHIINLLKPEFERLVPRMNKLGYLRENLLTEHGTNIYGDQAEKIVEVMLVTANKVFPFYITSFCIHGEKSPEYRNGLLSQWRAYGRGGFAIEFDELLVDRLNSEERQRWRYEEIFSGAVEYENHESKIDPRQFNGMAGTFLRRVIEGKIGFSDEPDVARKMKLELDEILGTAKPKEFAPLSLSCSIS